MPLHLFVGLLVAVIGAGALTVLVAPLAGGTAIALFLALALIVRLWSR